MPVRAAIEAREQEWRSKCDADGLELNRIVPARPGVVGTGNGAWDHRHAGFQYEVNGADAGSLKTAIPASLALDVDGDTSPPGEGSERDPDGLSVGLVAADREGKESFHEPTHAGHCELSALGHGVDRPWTDGLNQHRIEIALMIADQQEWTVGRNVREAFDMKSCECLPECAWNPLGHAVESIGFFLHERIRGWNSTTSPFPASLQRFRMAF